MKFKNTNILYFADGDPSNPPEGGGGSSVGPPEPQPATATTSADEGSKEENADGGEDKTEDQDSTEG